MLATGPRHSVRYWRPDTAAVSGMLRVEHTDQPKTTCTEQFTLVIVLEGAFEGWYRGAIRTHAAGSLKLTEPGEVHRVSRVRAPFTLQGAGFAPALVAEAARALGVRGDAHFRAAGFVSGERATALAFAMHDALVRGDATEIERATLVAEALGAVLEARPSRARAPRAVRLARAFLHDAFSDKVTLDELADVSGLDKFHLVRAFHAEVGLPPYEYVTHLRIGRAKELLRRGVRVADAAQAIGYCDESQLHRHFRRIVGVSPGLYARQHRPRHAAVSRACSRHEH